MRIKVELMCFYFEVLIQIHITAVQVAVLSFELIHSSLFNLSAGVKSNVTSETRADVVVWGLPLYKHGAEGVRVYSPTVRRFNIR